MHGKAKEQAEIDSEKEIIETSTVQAMGKNKYGDITTEGLQNELQGEATVEKIRKKIVVTFNDSQRMYYVNDNGNVFEYEYVELPVMENGSEFNNRMADYRASILTVSVLDNMDVPENAYRVFDVSKEQNETVKAWLVENEENTNMYDLYIGGNDGVEVEECLNMFASYSNCISIDVSNLYTDNVKNFQGMFSYDTGLQTIDLSNIDTCNATNMSSMFYTCTSLEQLDVSNFNTSNVINMSAMFKACSFSTIDLTNFVTTNVISMGEMFRDCKSLKEIDLSSFQTQKVTEIGRMFYNAKNLTTIYVSEKWSNENINNSAYMFSNCFKLRGNMEYDENKVDITYANYDTGYFTYKSNE